MAVGVITPIYNEAENLPRLLASVRNQSLRPTCWVIVDDGSTDASSALVESAAAETPWIRHRRRTDPTEYDIGANYARVLAVGFEELRGAYGDDLDYYMVLDGDMELTEGYIESVTAALDATDDLVIGCGPVYTRRGDGLDFEDRADKHPFGGATVYDGEFYRAIGGPPLTPCVDSVTKARARLRGARPRYFKDLDVKAIQSRPAHENGDTLSNARNLGVNNYKIGYPPLAALAKGSDLMQSSSFREGLAYLRGYGSVWARRAPRVADDDVVRYYYREKHRDVAAWSYHRLKRLLSA